MEEKNELSGTARGRWSDGVLEYWASHPSLHYSNTPVPGLSEADFFSVEVLEKTASFQFVEKARLHQIRGLH